MNNKQTYLDYAATTPTPKEVLLAMNDYYKNYRANVHRGLYETSIKATEKYEAARAQIAKFINADPNEIIFNSGATFGLNQLAYSLCPRLSHRDNIVLTRAEHHANLVPWQQMAKHYGFEIRFIELTKNFDLDIASAKKLVDNNTKIISLTYISNVLGTVNPVAEIIKQSKKINPKIYSVVDAAQAMAHIPVDVKKIDCDFLVFSGHKMYGPTGIGVLYAKKIMLAEHLEPFFFGGEMVKKVSFDSAEWNDIPARFEAGTPNIAGAIGLGAAVRYLQKIGFKKIRAHERELTKQLISGLSTVGARYIVPPSSDDDNRIGIVSFTVPGVPAHDVAEILNSCGVAVRAGFHCAEPLQQYLGLHGGTVRASIGLGTTKKDIDKLIAGIKKAQATFSL